MLATTKRSIIMFLIVSYGVVGCVSSNQVRQPELEEPKIVEIVEPSINPQSLEYLYQADNLAQFTKDPQYDRAIDLYSKAIEADPKNVQAYEGRADSYESLKHYDKAIADLTQSIAVEPQNVSAYKNRASIYYYHLDEGDRAIADLTEAINLATKEKSESRKRSPNLPDYKYYFVHLLYKFRANVFLELEQFDRAIDDANQLITLRPEAVSYHFRAGIYQEAKQYENAIADENQAIAMLPNYAHAHRRRAEIYGELKQYEQAMPITLKRYLSMPII